MIHLIKSSIVFLLFTVVAIAQKPVPQWLPTASQTVQDFKLCMVNKHGNSDCYSHLHSLLKTVYAQIVLEADLPLSPKAIATYLDSTSNWIRIGPAKDQIVLSKSQEIANQGQPVLAVSAFEPTGHIAIILPGQLQHSKQWNLSVPNSASLFRHKPQLSYLHKKLSYAFTKPDHIWLYAHQTEQ